jgi:hypothetical protein
MRTARKIGALSLGIMLMLCMSPVAVLAAEPVYEVSGDMLTVTYIYKTSEQIPRVDNTIEYERAVYELQSVSAAVEDPDYEHPTRHFTSYRSLEIYVDYIDTAPSRFAPFIPYEQGAFKGVLYLTLPLQQTLFEESLFRQVDREILFENLPNNDVVQIPETYEFEVTSDESEDATRVIPLDRLSVVWEIVGTNAAGRPNNYKATVVYRGEETDLRPDHYIVTATYTGDIAEGIDQYILTAIYKKTADPVVAPAPVAIESLPVPTAIIENPGFPWGLLFGALTAAALAIAASLLIFFWFRKQFKVCLVGLGGELTCVMKLRVVSDKGGLVVHIPNTIDLTNLSGEHVGICAKTYVKHASVMSIFQDDVKIYDDVVTERIPLFNEFAFAELAAFEEASITGKEGM